MPMDAAAACSMLLLAPPPTPAATKSLLTRCVRPSSRPRTLCYKGCRSSTRKVATNIIGLGTRAAAAVQISAIRVKLKRSGVFNPNPGRRGTEGWGICQTTMLSPPHEGTCQPDTKPLLWKRPSQGPAVCQSVQTAFRIHYKCEFGYHVDLSKKVPLAWCEGDMWSTTLALDLGATLEYKYVVCDSSGRAVRWQASDNLSLQLPTNAPVLDVCDSWDATVQSVLRPCPTPTDAGSQGVDSANLLNRGTASNVSNEGDSPTGSGTASIFSHELDTLRGFSSNPHLSDPHLSNPSSDFASRSLDGFLVNPLFEVAPDVPLFSQERELTSQVSISWWVPYHVQPGECLAVVGACPELGGWDPWRAVCLTWSEGDIWKGQTTIGGVEGGIESLEYKFVVLNRSGQVVRWYPARNSVVDFQPLQAEPAPRSQEPALGIPAQSPEQSPERSSYTS